MNEKNVKSLENLSKTCRIAGILPIFLGLLVLFIGVLNKDITSMLTGLFVSIVGYAFVKISAKVNIVLNSERA